jgi:hypothetical protein
VKDTARIDLMRQVLDKQLKDRHGEKIGKVDGLILGRGPGEVLRVVAIETGLPTVLRRVSRGLASVVSRFASRLSAPLLRSARMAFREVLEIDDVEIRMDVSAAVTAARQGERWLSEHVVRRIPGGGGRPRAPRERTGRPPEPKNIPGEIRLELALGRRIRAKNGRSIGRLEEVRAEKRGDSWEVANVRIGPAALFERIGAGTSLFGGRKEKGWIARCDQIDLSDPALPRLTAPFSELRRFEAPPAPPSP